MRDSSDERLALSGELTLCLYVAEIWSSLYNSFQIHMYNHQ